jgi:nucleotide-binding universal stress UspA family protein
LKLPERMVVGLDFEASTCSVTRGSLAAAETALWLARTRGEAHVTLVHSVVKDEYFDPLVDELVPICGTVEPAARLAVSKLVARFRAEGVGCETVDTSERPSVALAREVNAQRAQLALVGKHDGREADAARLGSVALRVLRESPCPVWSVVPGRAAIPRRILAATDLTLTGNVAVEWAANLALAAGAELHVAHIHPPSLHSRGARGPMHLAQLAMRATAQLGEQGRSTAQVHLREGSPAQELLALCEELEIDLAVLGAISHRRDEPGQIGSTTERVVLRSAASLLLVRAR